MSKAYSVFFIFMMFAFACSGVSYQAPDEGGETDHGTWTDLLQKHVDSKGDVDYKGFIEDSARLNDYLERLSANPPGEGATDDYGLAYWINAYNAYTVKLIIDNYPLESIQDLHPTLKIPGVNTVWHRKFFKIGGQEMSLDHIEHEILRKQYEEPRIHFAINCASVSCPPLLNEAYVPERIGEQLEQQARNFINNEAYNKITADRAEVSQIFNWFKKDFTENGSLIGYLNQYSDTKIKANATVENMNYDWGLNEQ